MKFILVIIAASISPDGQVTLQGWEKVYKSEQACMANAGIHITRDPDTKRVTEQAFAICKPDHQA